MALEQPSAVKIIIMLARLTGTIVTLAGSVAILDVGGVGYEVHCTSRCVTRLAEGERATIVIYTAVREDELKLYGFDDAAEKEVFLLLLKVSGIGAKTASEVLSQISATELLRAIGAGDLESLRAIKGVGKKTAERMVVELRDRVSDFAVERSERAQTTPSADDVTQDAILALQALGFQRKEASAALDKALAAGGSERNTGELVRRALQFV